MNTHTKNKTRKHLKRENQKIASDGNIYELQSWMNMHKDSDTRVTKEFLNGLQIFMYQAEVHWIKQETDKMLCPCRKYNNRKFTLSKTIWKHLVIGEFGHK